MTDALLSSITPFWYFQSARELRFVQIGGLEPVGGDRFEPPAGRVGHGGIVGEEPNQIHAIGAPTIGPVLYPL